MTKQLGLGSELGRRTGAVMAAEGVGIVASLGSLLLLKKIVGKEHLDTAKEWVAMHVVLPILQKKDATVTRFGKQQNDLPDAKGKGNESEVYDANPEELLDKAGVASGATSLKPVKNIESAFQAKSMSVEDRARKYADTVLDMTVMVPTGILARLAAQKKADKLFGAPEVPFTHKILGVEDTYWKARVVDAVGTQVSLVAMNTVAKAPAKAVVGVFERVLTAAGVSEVSANSMAKYLVYVQGSNVIGNSANVSYVTAVSRKHNAPIPSAAVGPAP